MDIAAILCFNGITQSCAGRVKSASNPFISGLECPDLLQVDQVRCTPPSTFFLHQHPLPNQILHIPQRRSLRNLHHLSPFDVFNFPSNPSSNLFSITRCRSFKLTPACFSQNFAFCNTPLNVSSVAPIALSKQVKNQSSQSVISSEPFCVLSKIS